MELRIPYKDLTIEILKDIDPYNPIDASELYENSDGKSWNTGGTFGRVSKKLKNDKLK